MQINVKLNKWSDFFTCATLRQAESIMAEPITAFPTAQQTQESNVISSAYSDFKDQLGRLRSLRNFVVREKVMQKGEPLPDVAMGSLNSIIFADEKGRPPLDGEWDDVNKKLQDLYGLLSDSDRRKFHFTLAAPMLKFTPTVLFFLSILFLIIPILVPMLRAEAQAPPLLTFGCFLGWIATLGALGSIAFILVNALGIQVDPTVDVTNKDSTMFRVLLGALFSLVLTLPFGYRSFVNFYKLISDEKATFQVQEASLLLAPFLFGFSTSLVLTVLNRLVEGVQTLFGVGSKKPG
jgi:hypothetical protein